MDIDTRSNVRRRRGPILLLALMLATAVALVPAGLLGAEPSASPVAGSPVAATPPASSIPAAVAMCSSGEDLRLIVEFVRGTDVEMDGWLPIFVGVIAGLAEARTLLGEVDSAYRPLVEDLVISLQDLFSIVDQVRGLDTLGSQVAAVGQAITAVGTSMDALSVALREPCPTTM